jgi:hypothetical protein
VIDLARRRNRRSPAQVAVGAARRSTTGQSARGGIWTCSACVAGSAARSDAASQGGRAFSAAGPGRWLGSVRPVETAKPLNTFGPDQLPVVCFIVVTDPPSA